MKYPVNVALAVVAVAISAGSVYSQQHQLSSTGTKAPASAESDPEYTLVLLNTNNDESLYPYAVNSHNEVTGQGYNAFLYKDGAITNITPPLRGYGTAINDATDIVGDVFSAGSIDSQAFLVTGGDPASFRYLDLGLPNIIQSQATGINNVGQIIGTYNVKRGNPQGFVYQNGKTSLLTGKPYQVPTAINDSGDIAGTSVYNAFLNTHSFTFPIKPESGKEMVVTGINASGTVVGFTNTLSNTSSLGFLYSAGKLTVLPNPSKVATSYTGTINDCGEFVGYSPDQYDITHNLGAFIYTHGAYKQLSYALVGDPYNTFEPRAINNRGDIVGEVVINSTAQSLLMVRRTPEKCGSDASIVNTPSTPTVGPAGEITYTITAKNLDSPVSQFAVTNVSGRESRVLSCAVSGSAGSCNKSADGQTLTVSLPNLTKGSTATIKITVHIAGTSGDDQLVMDTATLTSSATADYLSTAYTNIKLTADLSVNANLVSDQSGLLHYLATVTDLGPNNSHAALLLDQLPANTTFVSASTTAGTCSFHPTIGPNGAVRCPLGNLAHSVPAKVDVFLQASPAACPSVTNTFSLTGKSIDSNTSNDSSAVVTALSGSECISGMANR